MYAGASIVWCDRPAEGGYRNPYQTFANHLLSVRKNPVRRQAVQPQDNKDGDSKPWSMGLRERTRV